jgi:nucleoside-diphosphate-sugar epimerase
MTTQRALVTGGTGFLGAAVAGALVERDVDVTVFDVSTDERHLVRAGVADAVTLREGDVTDSTDVRTATVESGATLVVHLAALLSDAAAADPRAATRVNVGGTATVFEAALAAPAVERVVWASSAGVYAPPDRYDDGGDWWVDETALVAPATVYGASKAYGERLAATYRERDGRPIVGLRPTLVYGPGRETGSSASFGRLVAGPARGEAVSVDAADERLAWLHVDDAARAFAIAATVDADRLNHAVYNVRGPLATVREAAAVVRDLVPGASIDLSGGRLPWTQRLDATRAATDLGVEPDDDLRPGFRRVVDAVREGDGGPPA